MGPLTDGLLDFAGLILPAVFLFALAVSKPTRMVIDALTT